MFNKLYRRLPMVMVLTSLVGCASTTAVPTEAPAAVAQSSQVVAYVCGDGQNLALQAEYALIGADVAAAVLTFGNQTSPVLTRVIEDEGSNVYRGQGVVWVTEPADINNLATAAGRVLLQQVDAVEGDRQATYDQLTQDCRVVPH